MMLSHSEISKEYKPTVYTVDTQHLKGVGELVS